MRNLWTMNNDLQEIKAWQPNSWIQVTCPTQADLDYLQYELKIPDFFISDVADVDERARYDEEDGWKMIILRIPYMKDKKSRAPYTTIPLAVMLNKEYCITLCYYETNMMDDFIVHYKRKHSGFTDTVDFIFRLFLSSSVWYLKMLKRVNFSIDRAKRDLDKDVNNKDLVALSRLQDSLTYFITSIRGNENLLSKLKFKLPIDELDADLIEDVNIEMSQARETATIYSNILSGTMDTYASLISNNMNTVMRTLTSISIIMMFPTLIASIYGMNLFNGIESASWAFPLVIILTASGTIGIYWYLRRKHWV